MENYVIRFNESEREAVLAILARSNDIIINKVEPASASITIQMDDAETAHRLLLEQIDRELHNHEVVVVTVVEQVIIEPAPRQTDLNSDSGRRDHIL